MNRNRESIFTSGLKRLLDDDDDDGDDKDDQYSFYSKNMKYNSEIIQFLVPSFFNEIQDNFFFMENVDVSLLKHWRWRWPCTLHLYYSA